MWQAKVRELFKKKRKIEQGQMDQECWEGAVLNGFWGEPQRGSNCNKDLNAGGRGHPFSFLGHGMFLEQEKSITTKALRTCLIV